MNNFFKKIICLILAVVCCFNTATAQVCFSQNCDCHEKKDDKVEVKKNTCHSEVEKDESESDSDELQNQRLKISATCECCKMVELGVVREYFKPEYQYLHPEKHVAILDYTVFMNNYHFEIPAKQNKPPNS